MYPPTIDHTQVKLGKSPAKHDPRNLLLSKYVRAMAPPPLNADFTKSRVSWGMMLNDKLGDCTIAGVAHAVQVWTGALGAPIDTPDSQVELYYQKWDGYNPIDPSTDQGGVELNVMKQWKAESFDTHTLAGFTAISPNNTNNVKQAINLFGLVYIGVALPISAQGATVWDDTNDGENSVPGSWGGHCVICPKYGPEGVTCITWGGLQLMTWNFWHAYVDECYGLVSPDFLMKGMSPEGFDLTTLLSDLENVS